MSYGEVHLGDAIDFVHIQVVDRGTIEGRSGGDLRLSISVQSDDFSGKYGEVWIAKDDWATFLSSLRDLERERKGQAVLLSMAPEEFELRLRITDRAGHLATYGYLSRYHFRHPSGQAVRSRIEYCVNVDPSLLRELVELFTDLGEPTD